jgi:hypothetical protein
LKKHIAKLREEHGEVDHNDYNGKLQIQKKINIKNKQLSHLSEGIIPQKRSRNELGDNFTREQKKNQPTTTTLQNDDITLPSPFATPTTRT